VVTGMGGSAICGDILKLYLRDLDIPISVNRNYDLPKEAGRDTLLFVVSYSGNTEETISCYRQGVRKSCHIVSISSGGKIEELSALNRTAHIKIPGNFHPRCALGYTFFPLLRVLENSRIISSKERDVAGLIKNLGKKVFELAGLDLAKKLEGKMPIIYSSGFFAPVAYRWKTQFNEHSKVMSAFHVFSELTHNEILGYHNLEGKFHVVILSTDMDHRRITKRISITKKLLTKRGVDVSEIGIKGDSLLSKIFSAIYIGDWASFYLALKYKTDPADDADIGILKKEMGPFV